MRVAAVIPAFNEQDTVGAVVRGLFDTTASDLTLAEVIVVDNGSTDETAHRAEEAGATVLSEPQRGYGAACLRGLERALGADIVLFLDADGSDDPSEWPTVVAPIKEQDYDLVIGSRLKGDAEPGALSPHQRFGNWLACSLLRRLYGVSFTDLGPFRAIHADSLRQLEMEDQDFGWTVEMQIKAARWGLRCCEVPVAYRCRRGGRSKVSGTIKGSMLAAYKILGWLLRAQLGRCVSKT